MLAAAAGALALLQAAVLALGDPAAHLPAFLALTSIAFVVLFLAVPALEANRLSTASTAALVMGTALLLRCLALPLAPTLSNDVYRYLWDGRAAAAGENPYLSAPASPELARLRNDSGGDDSGGADPLGARLWENMDHREMPTVYPPLALGAFALAAEMQRPILFWKAGTALADLAGCWWLIVLAGRLGLPRGRAALYAWNPLVVLEGAGMGHVDVPAVAFAVAAAAALAGRRPLRAGLAAAVGILLKLGPLAALPAWAAEAWRRGGASTEPGPASSGRKAAALFLAAALGATAVGLLPVAVSTGGVPPGLVRYGIAWEFGGPLYEPLWRGLDAAGAAEGLARGVDSLKVMTGQHGSLNRIYPYLYPQLLAKIVLAGGMLTAVAAAVRAAARGAGPARAGLLLFGGLLLASATVYPWYLLWVLPWAALTREAAFGKAWLAASGLVLLTYLAQPGPESGPIPLWPWLYLAVWGPFFLLLVTDRLLSGPPEPGGRQALPSGEGGREGAG